LAEASSSATIQAIAIIMIYAGQLCYA
jgi:hypothetical protein